ncbi:NADP-dependent 3-hydroxy acid dehydrogenase YdfG [Kutzneria viridogrisea]|uniref:NADP-dependent 3-hydroxy acid dehydrogenase YdfG n=1 Tax=Kutzneria viridogrisea TaxID=47990 RepID=A0ABR6B924_9PSEU|nr:NADP-dependent 3-hydroxy acid dehydrogenase YdfG [Kutzneria viridogrisea]
MTGASSGMGAATAELLAAQGVKVALLARRAHELDALAEKITTAGGTALSVPLDLTDVAAVHAAAAQVRTRLGRPSIVFNNAGIMLPSSVEGLHDQRWRRQIDLNVTAAVTTAAAFVTDLVAAAAEGGPADLITTSSVAAKRIVPSFAVYSATKAFLTHFTHQLRAELGPRNVRVSVIEPGIVSTELWSTGADRTTQEWYAKASEHIEPLRPADIAEIVVYTVGLPKHVNLQQIAVMPTRQA